MERILCFLGFHKIRKGVGWTSTKRFDICLRCKYTKWVDGDGWKDL